MAFEDTCELKARTPANGQPDAFGFGLILDYKEVHE
jgi:hypothetical protein